MTMSSKQQKLAAQAEQIFLEEFASVVDKKLDREILLPIIMETLEELPPLKEDTAKVTLSLKGELGWVGGKLHGASFTISRTAE